MYLIYRYGLIEKKSQQPTRLAAFMSDSDSDEGPKKKKPSIELGEAQKRQAKLAQQKAVEEDPTIYQYDELYDEMDNKRKEAKIDKSKIERKPKYINKLLEMADKRKKEHERRVERQVQKEREEEGEKFKDKESFVTSAYRQKLEEMRQAEELEKREEYLEAIGDVTKQGNLDGFYRHIYAQKLDGDDKVPVVKPEVKVEAMETPSSSAKISKSHESHSKKERKYRKHHSEDEEEETKSDSEAKKVHLQSNLDADSDFSIDSDSDSEASQPEKDENPKEKEIKPEPQSPEFTKAEPTEEKKLEVKVKTEEKEKIIEPKKPKIDIWKKRTVGEAYEAAVKRYYERKATREAGL